MYISGEYFFSCYCFSKGCLLLLWITWLWITCLRIAQLRIAQLGITQLGIAWLGITWLGIALLGIAWLGIPWLGIAPGSTMVLWETKCCLIQYFLNFYLQVAGGLTCIRGSLYYVNAQRLQSTLVGILILHKLYFMLIFYMTFTPMNSIQLKSDIKFSHPLVYFPSVLSQKQNQFMWLRNKGQHFLLHFIGFYWYDIYSRYT